MSHFDENNNIVIDKGLFSFEVLFKDRKTGTKRINICYGFKNEEQVRKIFIEIHGREEYIVSIGPLTNKKKM